MIDSSLQNGVSVRRSCSILMIQYRRIVRWQQRVRRGRGLQDRRPGPTEPLHKLLPEETSQILAMAKDEQYADLSHRILAVTAADKGLFQASFSTVYRVLRKEGLMTARGAWRGHNGHSKPPVVTGHFKRDHPGSKFGDQNHPPLSARGLVAVMG